MIDPRKFVEILIKKGINFFTGVPDSLLKDFCAYLTETSGSHIIAANEGGAIALAAGYQIASGNIPLVYMQNSGIGNSINPILSLADQKVYSIPMILLIGWRGEPGIKDEPQHISQGEVTLDLVKALRIQCVELSDIESVMLEQIETCVKYLKINNCPYAFIVRKNLFKPYNAKKILQFTDFIPREEAIKTCVSILSNEDVVVSTTGMISRELYEYRDFLSQGHNKDFLTVGSMGHASQIALGIALDKKKLNICCFDGDGSILMHMGSLAIIGNVKPKNFVHIIFNNGAHDSVGGQPTVCLNIDLPKIAIACGYKNAVSVISPAEFIEHYDSFKFDGPSLIEFKVKKGARSDLGRPKFSPLENKTALIQFLKNY